MNMRNRLSACMSAAVAVGLVIALASCSSAPKPSSKHVSGSDYPGTWPFVYDEGTLQCGGGTVTITIGDIEYFLNGHGRPSRTDQKSAEIILSADPHNPNLKMSMAPLIAEGQKLC